MADMVHGEEEGVEDEDQEEEEENAGEVEEEENAGEVEEEENAGEGEEERIVEGEEVEQLREGESGEAEAETETSRALAKDVCYHCHQPGHKARKCPLLHPEMQKQVRMKEKKNITSLEIRSRVAIEDSFYY